MAVYVDQLMQIGPYSRSRGTRWKWPHACHMFADTVPELHAFAKRLGLRRGWFQAHRILPHYDLTERMRDCALKLGAIEKTVREHIKEQRPNAPSPGPT